MSRWALSRTRGLFYRPDTGRVTIFLSTGGAVAGQLDVPLLGQIPLSMSIREGGDTGRPAVTGTSPDGYADVFREIARRLAARVSVMEYA